MKVVAGFLIGVGLAFGWTGLGIGLIGAGAVLWFASTATSSAGLKDKGIFVFAIHIAWSLLLGTGGAFAGLLNFGTGAALAAGISPKLAAAGEGLQTLSVAGPMFDLVTILTELPEQTNPPPPATHHDYLHRFEVPVRAEFSAGLASLHSLMAQRRAAFSDPANPPTIFSRIRDTQIITLHEFIERAEIERAELSAQSAPGPLSEIDSGSLFSIGAAEPAELRPKGNFITDLNLITPFQANSTPGVIERIKGQLVGVFDKTHHSAVRCHPFSGEEVTFHLANGRDCATFDAVAETIANSDAQDDAEEVDAEEQTVPNSAKEWIAVLRSDKPVAFDLMLKSTYEQLSIAFGQRKNPVSRMLLTDAVTVRGELLAEILDWPLPAQPSGVVT